MTTTAAARKLGALLSSVERRRPMRAGSLIVTICGNGIVPRGGFGSLLELMSGFGVAPAGAHAQPSPGGCPWFERTHWQSELLPAVGLGCGGARDRYRPHAPPPASLAGSLDGLRLGVAAGGRLRDVLKSTWIDFAAGYAKSGGRAL